MKHYILTRFNDGIYGRTHILDPDRWMIYRINIFRRFTVPSILKQTSKNFTWLIKLDPQTPEHHRQYINKLVNPLGVTVDSFPPHFHTNHDLYLYTLIDNDDAMPIDYIEQIQNRMEIIKPPFVFDMSFMFRVTKDLLHYQIVYQHIRRADTSFYSEIYTVVETKPGVPPANHCDAAQAYERNIILPCAGVQILHKANVCNLIHGNKTGNVSPVIHQFPDALLYKYGWDYDTLRNTWLEDQLI